MRIGRRTEQRFIEPTVRVVTMGTGSVEDHKPQKMGDGSDRLMAGKRLKQGLARLGGGFGFAHIVLCVAERGEKVRKRENFLDGESSNGCSPR